MAKRPGGAMLQTDTPTRSEWVPVLTKWKDVGQKSEFAPILVTIVTVLLLFFLEDEGLVSTSYQVVVGNKVFVQSFYTSWYLVVVCIYLMLLSVYFIRRLAGKNKSWLLLIGTGAFTAYMLYLFKTEQDFYWMYSFFHDSLAGGEITARDETTQVFVKHFLGTGFFEETFKAVPLFIIALAGIYMPQALRSKFGIEEPLDGILLGAASGGGFAFMESISQYISNTLIDSWQRQAAITLYHIDPQKVDAWLNKIPAKLQALVTLQGAQMLGWYPGLPLLIPRSLSEAFGHMAYAGCFGYFIGLAILKPQQRWKTLAIGLVTSSLIHALWDTLSGNNLLELIVAILSYAILAAGILKAREISPNRATLLPSIFIGSLSPTPSVVAAYAAASPAVGAPRNVPISNPPGAPAPKVVPGPNPLPNGTASLRIGARYLVIVPGLRLMSHQVPGLHAQSAEGLVAEVTRNPTDPDVLGLTNMSTASWEVVTPSNTRRIIQPGQTVKLSPGTRIDFGETDGEVR